MLTQTTATLVPELHALDREAQHYPLWTQATWTHVLNEDNHVLLCRHDKANHVIAYILLRAPTRHLVIIRRIAVHPDHRRQGLASWLINNLKANFTTVVARIPINNTPAACLLRSCGIKCVAEIGGYYAFRHSIER